MTNQQHGGDNSANTQQNINEMSGGTAIQNQYNYYTPPTAPPDYKPGSLSAVSVSDPDDVPRQPKHFIGRADLRTRTLEILDAGKNALLCGFGGMGKTALASVITADWIRASRGAALWLQAGSGTPDALFEALARPFGREREIAALTGDAKTAKMREILRDSGVELLTLDDAWNGEALRELESALPRDLRLLVTSRYKWPLDAEFVDVGQLPPDEALELLTTHARRQVDGPELCKRLGYHAFALEIAGKTLHADGIDPAQLLKRMGDRPHALAAPDGFAETGCSSVADLIDASLNALDENTKTVFLAFGAFFTPSATAELLQIFLNTPVPSRSIFTRIFNGLSGGQKRTPITIEQSLDTLTRRGLADKIPASDDSIPYYRVHDLAYSYARDHHDDSARDSAAIACLTYTGRYNSPSLDNFKALRPELDNFIGASKWAMAREKYAVVEDFAWNLYSASGSQFLSYRGFYTQAVELLALAADAAEKQDKRYNQGAHLNNLGLVYADLGQYRRAIDYHQQALAIHRDIGDRRGEGAGLGNLGNSYADLGQYDQAIDYYQQALVIARDIGDKRGEGADLGNQGLAYKNLGQYDKAIDYYQQALVIARDIGDKRGEGNWLGNLGNAYSNLGQYDQAIDYYQQALAISRDIGDRQGEASDLNNIGALHEDQENYPLALDFYQQARAIYEAIGTMHIVERVDSRIARVRAKLSGS